jgi:hypothetical protein
VTFTEQSTGGTGGETDIHAIRDAALTASGW